jgi:hypothetical protein
VQVIPEIDNTRVIRIGLDTSIGELQALTAPTRASLDDYGNINEDDDATMRNDSLIVLRWVFCDSYACQGGCLVETWRLIGLEAFNGRPFATLLALFVITTCAQWLILFLCADMLSKSVQRRPSSNSSNKGLPFSRCMATTSPPHLPSHEQTQAAIHTVHRRLAVRCRSM